MARNEEQKKKGSGGKVAGAAAILLLLAGGGWLGFGGGSGLLNGNGAGSGGNSVLPSTTQTTQTATAQPSAAPEAQDNQSGQSADTLAIVVSESSITVNGADCDIECLEKTLLVDYTDGKKVTLTDDKAIKGTYDSVAALLERLDIPFTVE